MATAQITLQAATGRTLGTRPSRRLRAEGRIPAVVYGSGTDPVAVTVEWSELRAALTTAAGLNALVVLDVDGDERLTLVREIQRHPVRREVTHVDFVVVDRNKPVHVEVPVLLVDTDVQALSELVVDQQLFTLAVAARPDAIPNELVVSVADLTLDTPIRAADVELPAGVELDVDPEDAIVTASLPLREEDLVPDTDEGDVDEVDGDEVTAEGDDSGSTEDDDSGDDAATEG